MNVEERRGLRMLTVDEALHAVLDAAEPLPAEDVALAAAAGRWLAEDLKAAADMPPFDRSAMDGYAVLSADTAVVPVVLEVVEEIPAGRDPAREVRPGQASRIMTGAAIPGGADAVVMVERTETLLEGRRVRILEAAAPGQHVRRRGEDLRAGSLLLARGAFLGAPETALLAGEGRSRVLVGGRPSVAILSTGDELVGVEETPRGSRIRETNSWSLATLLRRIGIEPRVLGIAPDDREALAERAREGSASDVLILSGGVSMGERDLVGEVLRGLGCRPFFERVAIQPGKPLFFGVAARGGGSGGARTVVFGLPGNPVSSVVDFLIFARPALRKMMGAPRPCEPALAAVLTEPVRRRPGRRGYLPARVEAAPGGGLTARALPSMGSADLVALGRANALLVAPEDRSTLEKGEAAAVILLDDPFLR